ncbi:MAG: hypothetical protein EKK33_15415 [Bradyrhizobiaceae bacterium]|nr:MAG: hypothetical protein EKK33_15415 [Bradyrhizobiaceae bacterium]
MRRNPVESGGDSHDVPGNVAESNQSLTFLATIGGDVPAMKFLGMITILALLTMGGAAISDQLLTAEQHVAQGVE